jgi:hypothetical protein
MRYYNDKAVRAAANTLLNMRGDTSMTLHKDSANLRKGKKNPTTRRRKRQVVEPNIAKSTAVIEELVIEDKIPNDLDVPSIILLLGECLLYESLFIWQREAMERFKTDTPTENILFGGMLPVIRNNHRALVELLLELPRIKSLNNYNQAVESGDVSNRALITARGVVLRFVTIQQFECSDEIIEYFEKNIKTRYIPKANIAQPIISTFCSCLNIVSVEGNSH